MRWRTTETSEQNYREGQAMVELIISLVVFLVVVAGIIQIGTLGLWHTKVVSDARQDAAVEAMSDLAPFSNPEFIEDRDVGGDGVRYSQDDGFNAGSVDDFRMGIVDNADPDVLDQRRPGNIVSAVAAGTMPHFMFGFVEGTAEETVGLWPIVRRLLYQDEAIELKGKVWLVWTKGIY
jgi:hypothetical protein